MLTLQFCKSASLQVCKSASLQVCKSASVAHRYFRVFQNMATKKLQNYSQKNTSNYIIHHKSPFIWSHLDISPVDFTLTGSQFNYKQYLYRLLISHESNNYQNSNQAPRIGEKNNESKRFHPSPLMSFLMIISLHLVAKLEF